MKKLIPLTLGVAAVGGIYYGMGNLSKRLKKISNRLDDIFYEIVYFERKHGLHISFKDKYELHKEIEDIFKEDN